MTLVQNWQQDIFSAVKFDEFLSNLKTCRIADIGKIEVILEGGAYANVRLLDGTNQVIKAEVFGEQVRSGQYCMLIIPASPVSVSKGGLDVAERSYASTHAKCFPLQSPTFSSVKVTHDVDTYNISTPSYTLQCDSQGIAIIDSQGLSVGVKNGVMNISNNDGSSTVTVDSSGIKIEAGNTYSESGKESKAVVSISNDGQISMTTKGQVNLKADELSVEAESLSIEGDVEIDGKLEVTKNFSAGDGNFTVDV